MVLLDHASGHSKDSSDSTRPLSDTSIMPTWPGTEYNYIARRHRFEQKADGRNMACRQGAGRSSPVQCLLSSTFFRSPPFVTVSSSLLYVGLLVVFMSLLVALTYCLIDIGKSSFQVRPGPIPLVIHQPIINMCTAIRTAADIHDHDALRHLVHTNKDFCLHSVKNIDDLPESAPAYARGICMESRQSLHRLHVIHKDRLTTRFRNEPNLVIHLCQNPSKQLISMLSQMHMSVDLTSSLNVDTMPPGWYDPRKSFALIRGYLNLSSGWSDDAICGRNTEHDKKYVYLHAAMTWALDLLEYVARLDLATKPLEQITSLRSLQSSNTEVQSEKLQEALQETFRSRSVAYNAALGLLVSVTQSEALICSLRAVLFPLEMPNCPGLEYALIPMKASTKDIQDPVSGLDPVTYFEFVSLTTAEAREKYNLHVQLPPSTSRDFRIHVPGLVAYSFLPQQWLGSVMWAARRVLCWTISGGPWSDHSHSEMNAWMNLRIPGIEMQKEELEEALHQVREVYGSV